MFDWALGVGLLLGFLHFGKCLNCDFSTEDINAIVADYNEVGFDVTLGELHFFQIEYCINSTADMGKCQYQNADNPYVMTMFTRTDTEAAYDIDSPRIVTQSEIRGERAFASWRMRPDESIVYVGCTPPEVRYWSSQPYLLARWEGNKWHYPFASIGDSLNILEMQTEGPTLWDTRYAQTLVWDEGIADKVEAVLARHFDGNSWLNRIAIGKSFYEHTEPFRWGLHEHADLFNSVFRMAYPLDKAAMAEYKEKLPLYPLRLTPRVPLAAEHQKPFPPPVLKDRYVDFTEEHLQPAIDFLREKITTFASLEGRVFHSLLELPGMYIQNAEWGADCVHNFFGRINNCYGDTRDSHYTLVQPNAKLDRGDFMYVFGVNHNKTGLVTYTNLVVYDIRYFVGLFSVPDLFMIGSADRWLHGSAYDVDSDLFYVVKLAFRCEPDEEDCYEIPVEGESDFPSVNPGEASIVLIERAYLNANTTLGPQLRNIIAPQYVVVKKSTGLMAYGTDKIDIAYVLMTLWMVHRWTVIGAVALVMIALFRVLRSTFCGQKDKGQRKSQTADRKATTRPKARKSKRD
eukprot:Rmarinus@m.4350